MRILRTGFARNSLRLHWELSFVVFTMEFRHGGVHHTICLFGLASQQNSLIFDLKTRTLAAEIVSVLSCAANLFKRPLVRFWDL